MAINMNVPKVIIEDIKFEESCFVRGSLKWNASTLYKQAEIEKLEPFDFPLVAFDSSCSDIFALYNMNDFIFQCKRVLNCNKEYPIILDNFGQIADGYHRVCKAILDGDTTIKAFRLNKMPKEDFIINN